MHNTYPLADAAVAFEDRPLVRAVLQRALHLDGDGHGPAVAASVVDLGVFSEARRAGLGSGILRRHVLRIKLGALEPGSGSESGRQRRLARSSNAAQGRGQHIRRHFQAPNVEILDGSDLDGVEFSVRCGPFGI